MYYSTDFKHFVSIFLSFSIQLIPFSINFKFFNPSLLQKLKSDWVHFLCVLYPGTENLMKYPPPPGFYPKITVPIRLSNKHGTLINNMFCNLTDNTIDTTSGVLISKIFDHQPYFIILCNVLTKQAFPIFVKINQQDKDSMKNFENELHLSMNSFYLIAIHVLTRILHIIFYIMLYKLQKLNIFLAN